MIKELKTKSKASIVGTINIVFRYLIIKYLFKKNILLGTCTTCIYLKNITTNGFFKVGIDSTNFTYKDTKTFLKIRGKMTVSGNFTIAKGNRFDIGESAIVELGDNSYINPFGLFIIMDKLIIGNNCSISWNCHFLDDDFHTLEYEGKQEKKNKGIEIGNKVWIGANVSIYKGSKIPDGCVVAANSVVRGIFTQKNCLIAGFPAKVIKENINWK